MADLLTRLGLRRPIEVRASAVSLDPAQQPERPLEKSWDDATLLTVYQDDPWPYVATNIIAENGSKPPLKVGTLNTKSEFKPVPPTHPVQQLLDDPNPHMTGNELVQMLLIYLQIVGHSPIEIVFPQRRRPLAGKMGRDGFELYAVNPSQWKIVPRSDGTISGYVQEQDARIVRKWSPEQMTYLRWLNPRDRFYGLGWVPTVRQPIMAEEYAAIRDKEFERRYGVPPGILTSKLPIGTPQATELQKRWEQMTGGYKNAGRIAVLGNDTTYQAIALTARDALELDNRKWRVQQIAGASGVPMVVLVGMKDATFANAGEAVDFLWEMTLQPKLDRIARMVTKRLLPLLTTEKLVARFDYSEVDALNENELEVAQRLVAQVSAGAMPTVDEVRERLGFGPHPNTEVGLMLVKPQALSIEKADAMLALSDLGVQGAEAALELQKNPPEEPPEKPPAKSAKSRRYPDERAAATNGVRIAFSHDLTAFFAAQQKALWSVKTLGALATKESLPGDLLDDLLSRINEMRWQRRLGRITREYLEMALRLGEVEATRLLGVSLSIPASEEALGSVTSHLDNLGVTIQRTTNDDVRRVITEGLSLGESAEQLRMRVDALFEGYEQWRVDRIVRTEVSAAYEMGALQQFKGADVQLVDVDDGDQDEECAAANGSVWTVEEAMGNPLEHPNCLPGDTSVVAPNTRAAFARRYEGEIVIIQTAAGHELRGTPNHPVLTRDGWRPLGALGEGDYVVRARLIERVANWLDPDHNHVPAPIAEIAEALPVVTAAVPVAAEDFHGDVADGDVYVVRTNSLLDHRDASALGEPNSEQDSTGRDVLRHAALAGERAAVQVLVGALHPAHGGVGLLTDPSTEAGLAQVAQSRGLAATAQVVSGAAHTEPEMGAVLETDRRSNLLDGLADLVTLDEIIYRDRAVWAGHVYNLETVQGWYMADGIITHNCTRVFTPHTEDER